MTRVVTLINISYDNIFHLIMVNRLELHLIRIAIDKMNRRQLLVCFKTCVQEGSNHWNRLGGGDEFTFTENVNDF